MLQRLQTVYLLIVSALTALLLFFPFVRLNPEAAILAYPAHYFLSPLVVLNLLLSFGSIFLYKNRSWQIKVNYVNILVFAVLYALAFWQILETGFEFMTFQLVAAIPLVNIILTFLAIFRIKKDEKLVRSLDRLR